jgi:GNAT superfamily N-acetyltransferase
MSAAWRHPISNPSSHHPSSGYALAHVGGCWQARRVIDDDFVVRTARRPDRDHVWPLARDFATSFRLQRSAFDAAFESLLGQERTLVLVAEAPPLGVVGYLVANWHLTFLANGPVAWVEEVMVDERVRRDGHGSRLIEAAEVWAREGGAAYIALASRRAGAFYLALGYEDSAVFFRKTLG